MERRVSRRGFLRQSALTSVTALVGSSSIAEADDRRGREQAIAAPNETIITLSVNGTSHELQVEPRITLAEALRDVLGLRGTKIGCNRGACSACTIWLDGIPVCSCMLLAVDAVDRRVTTIEGLSDGEGLHPIQATFIEFDAVQCGYCTPGMVMSCAALLRDHPGATDTDVRRAISGHICRCGTYPHVIAAALAVASRQKT